MFIHIPAEIIAEKKKNAWNEQKTVRDHNTSFTGSFIASANTFHGERTIWSVGRATSPAIIESNRPRWEFKMQCTQLL